MKAGKGDGAREGEQEGDFAYAADLQGKHKLCFAGLLVPYTSQDPSRKT